MSFPRYREYKDSGVEWLGDVPGHWEVKRIKRLVATLEQGWSPQCEGFPVQSEDEWGVLKVGCVNGGVFRPEENKALPPELEPVPTLGLAAGDLLISRANTRELVGGAAIVLQAYPRLMLCDKLYRIRLQRDACVPTYLASYLGTAQIRSQIELAATGASSSMLNIGQSTILELAAPVPPLAEQITIATFLDRETAKIDALVAEQEKLIGLLQEKRQAVISHAVTKGLDPNVPMKNSGVEWLGEVPGHWEVKAIKWLSPVSRGASPRPIEDPKYFDEDGEYAWVRIADSTASVGVLTETTQRLSALGSSLSVKLEVGQLFVSIAGTVGKPCITAVKACIHDGFVYFPRLKINPKFLFRIFEAGVCYGGLGKMGTQLNLNTDTIGSIRVAVPPPAEITQVLVFVDQETAKLDTLMAEARSAITLLQERRTALISAAVTGQIDVRGLAGGANAPDLIAASAYAESA